MKPTLTIPSSSGSHVAHEGGGGPTGNNGSLKRDLGLRSATLVVISSMVGAGIFGNTGIIQAEVGNPLMVLFLWFLGGVIALAGALSYAELSTMMPRAGGDYLYLKRSFGLLPSFLTGWVSFLVGFAAPVASAALLASEYTYEFLQVVQAGSSVTRIFGNEMVRKFFAVFLVLSFSLLHALGVRKGSMVQNMLSGLKLTLMIAFAIGGLVVSFLNPGIDFSERLIGPDHPMNLSGIGVGLLFVMFAYSGWNGATYLAEEIKDPGKNLPKALIRGTLLTVFLYLAINVVYYLAIPRGMMEGEEAVAALAATYLFGNNITVFFHLAFGIMLLSTISVSLMIGPRVYFAMARDNLFFDMAARIHPGTGTPVGSIMVQAFLAVFYIFTGKYDEIMAYMGFALSLFPVLTVYSVIHLRRTEPDAKRPYKMPFYPFLPIFFIIFSIVIIITSFVGRPTESVIALVVVLSGIPVFYLWRKWKSLKADLRIKNQSFN